MKNSNNITIYDGLFHLRLRKENVLPYDGIILYCVKRKQEWI